MKQEKQTILDWYREKQAYIEAPCGGMGNCGKCKVRFKSEAPEPSKRERELLSEEEIANHIRLACMTQMVKESEFFLVGEVFETETTLPIVNREITYGIAIDIGTTTLVMQLVDMVSGEAVVTLSEVNPQRMYGADVLTRIKLANEGNLFAMQRLIQQALSDLLRRLLAETQIGANQVKKIAIVGNTTMLHILQGFSCDGLGVAPFKAVDISMRQIKPDSYKSELGLEAEIYILPGISTFIGADIVAGIYACDMDLKETPHMLVDVGTNGEMVVGDKHGFFVTSTAAGPVFEGGNISCGMPSVRGGVTHLHYAAGAWAYESIDGQKPCGICGTGLIDLLAECARLDVVDENGTLIDAFFENGYPVVLPYGEHAIQLLISQSDIRELQMGKSAIRAGMECLFEKKKPQTIYLAGAFGARIDLVKGAQIGLFSKEAAEIIESVGNTAIKGAQKFLLDTDGAVRVQQITALAKEILLANAPDFYERYIQYMQLEK